MSQPLSVLTSSTERQKRKQKSDSQRKNPIEELTSALKGEERELDHFDVACSFTLFIYLGKTGKLLNVWYWNKGAKLCCYLFIRGAVVGISLPELKRHVYVEGLIELYWIALWRTYMYSLCLSRTQVSTNKPGFAWSWFTITGGFNQQSWHWKDRSILAEKDRLDDAQSRRPVRVTEVAEHPS